MAAVDPPSGILERFSGDPVRQLRAVKMPEGALAQPVGDTTVIGVLDTETTGFDPEKDVIIELAIRRVRIDAAGNIVEIGQGRNWLEDPGRPLEPDVSRLTGLTERDLAGQRIDDDAAIGLLNSVDWICAHNSAFDRRFVERRLPDAAGGRWCCSCVDVDWAARGLEGRGLGWLLSQTGLCHAGHRAMNDVDAVVALLATQHGERTAFAEMVENATSPAFLVTAVGASFSVKEALRRRGYRWSTIDRVWQREIPDRDRQSEEFWLARNIYSPEANAQALGPRIDAVDPAKRFL